MGIVPRLRLCWEFCRHCSTESEAISLDAGFCMEGIFVFDRWGLVIEV